MLWKGPIIDGITCTYLYKFLLCRHRFWLKMNGIEDTENLAFSHKREYGTIFHNADEAVGKGKDYRQAIRETVDNLNTRFPGSESEIAKQAEICLVQFPIYLKFWKHEKQTSLHNELEFYLPDYENIRLRGKIDEICKIGNSVYLKETKTKGTIDEDLISRTIKQNMQVMYYMYALLKLKKAGDVSSLPTGILYNVIRRPSTTGKLGLYHRKTETWKEYLKRLSSHIEGNAKEYFYRWKTPIQKVEILHWYEVTLRPILIQLFTWWNSLKDTSDPFESPYHFQSPFGNYDSINLGYRGEYYSYLTQGKGIVNVENLFPELSKVE